MVIGRAHPACCPVAATAGQLGGGGDRYRWPAGLPVVHGEFATFRAGDHHGAVTASLGPDRALRKTYKQSLARAHALGASSIQSARSSVTAASSRSVMILVVCLMAALAIGSDVALWLVRSIARPVARLAAIVGGDLPS
jgi:hypothetical protein